MTAEEDIYSSRKISLPTPHFVVFYNGRMEMPERFEYRLSDCYEVKEESYALELKVQVYNINNGMNRELMESCKTLQDYAVYVELVREYERSMDRQQAVELAVDYCITHDILRSFLVKNKAEVVSMTIFEYDEQEYKELQERKLAEKDALLEEKENTIEKLLQEIERLKAQKS